MPVYQQPTYMKMTALRLRNILKKIIINIEILKNLDLCDSDFFEFVCLTLTTKGFDGAPCVLLQ